VVVVDVYVEHQGNPSILCRDKPPGAFSETGKRSYR